MSKWNPTPFEILTAAGVVVVSGASASPASILPTLGLCAAGIYAARRSERLGRLAGNTPARLLLVDGSDDDSESTKLALPAQEKERREKERAIQKANTEGRFRFKMLNSLMDNISSNASRVEDDAVQKSALEEVNPDKAETKAAQPTEKAPKPEKQVKKDDDAAWVAQAGASVPDGLEAGKVASLRQVVEALNKQVDDFPHVFVVGDSGAGKTTLVQLIVGTRPGKVVILDPKRPKGWEGPKWGGLPYVSRDKQTASYKPMVLAMAEVVREMDRRYRTQDEATEPFEMLTVVLDEGKNSVEESPELAALYRKIVSIGREVGIRLILISTTDRAGKLGFDGEADSMDSFAWVQLGEMALRVRGDLRERGKGQPKQKVYWAVASFAGGWIPFENERAFNLLPSLNLRRTKSWGKVQYNCQAEVVQPTKKDDYWPEEREVSTRQMQAVVLADEGNPVDDFLAGLLAVAVDNRSVKDNDAGVQTGVQNTPSALPSALPATSSAELRPSDDLLTKAQNVKKTLAEVPAQYRPELRNALQKYAQNGRKVTPAIREVYGFTSGDRFGQIAAWLRAAADLADAMKAQQK